MISSHRKCFNKAFDSFFAQKIVFAVFTLEWALFQILIESLTNLQSLTKLVVSIGSSHAFSELCIFRLYLLSVDEQMSL